MRKATWSEYVWRVGGLGAIYVAAILAARVWLPGYESTFVLVITGVVLVTLILQSIRKTIKAKRRESKKA